METEAKRNEQKNYNISFSPQKRAKSSEREIRYFSSSSSENFRFYLCSSHSAIALRISGLLGSVSTTTSLN
ncbi:hypothetical protein K1719_034889 [Acacia pycnantha]|nr:hypothetical protein K1719_034889 [Acacia pycnantha]